MRKALGWLAAALSLGAMLVVAAWTLRLAYERGRTTPYGSSFRSDAEGARALFLLLEEMGHQPKRLTRPAPPPQTLLVSVEPLPSDAEANHELLGWLEDGGTLVLIGSVRILQSPASKFFRFLPRRKSLLESLNLKIVAEQAPSATGGAGASDGSSTEAKHHWTRLPEGARVLVGTAAAPVLAEFSYGAGRVYALAEPSWFENAGIATSNHLQLAVRLIVEPGKPVYFDEYRHGMAENAGLAYVLHRYGLVPAAIAVVMFLSFVAWKTTPREAEPAPVDRTRTDPVRDSLIEARAALYAQVLRPSDALKLLEHDFRQNLSAALGERHNVSWTDARRKLMENHPMAVTRFDAVLAELERSKAKTPTRTDELLPLSRNMVTLVNSMTSS